MHNYREILPASRLTRYVECYWSREDLHGTPRHCVLPDGCVDIIFSTVSSEPQGLALVGLMTAAQIFDIRPAECHFGVRFRPGMAAAFMPEVARLNDRIEALENIMGSNARDIFEQLSESSGPEQMARVMDVFLRPLKPPDVGQSALQRLSISEHSIERVAFETSLSTRQLRRLCLERAGVSPKFLSRILRFRKAVQRIAISPNSSPPNWAQLAALCGYYDQAHFIREFQEFTGRTPGRYLQSLPTASQLESAP